MLVKKDESIQLELWCNLRERFVTRSVQVVVGSKLWLLAYFAGGSYHEIVASLLVCQRI